MKKLIMVAMAACLLFMAVAPAYAGWPTVSQSRKYEAARKEYESCRKANGWFKALFKCTPPKHVLDY